VKAPLVKTWLALWLVEHQASRPGKEGWPSPGTPAAKRCWSDWLNAFIEAEATRQEAEAASKLLGPEPIWCEDQPAAVVATIRALRIQQAERAKSAQAAALEQAGVVFEEGPEARMDRAAEALAEFSRLGWKHVFHPGHNRFTVERANPDAPAISLDLSMRMREYAYEMRILLGKPWPTWEECLRPDGSFDWRKMAALMDGGAGGVVMPIGGKPWA
jgi:hypothetical protein